MIRKYKVRNKVLLSLIVWLVMFSSALRAQLDDLGIHLGGAAYFGDLTPRVEIYSTGEESYALGLSASMIINDFLSVRGMVSHLRFSGDDRFQKDENRRLRNLHFRNRVWDANVMLDANLSDWLNPHYRRFQVHILAGIGVFNHNPQAEIDGRWYDLQPLGTEGQSDQDTSFFGRTPYALTQVNVPVSLQLEYEISKHWSVSLEYIHRFLFTDYLDDVSSRYPVLEDLDPLVARLSFRTPELEGMQDAQPIGIRGNSDRNDAYSSLQLSIVYRLQPGKSRDYGWRHR